MRQRIIILFFTVVFLFVAVGGRLGYLTMGNTVNVADTAHSYSLLIDTLQPNVYTADGKLLTNNQTEYAVVLRPNEATFSELYQLFDQAELPAIVSELEQGYPVVKSVGYTNTTSYLTPIAVTTSASTCSQLLDKSSAGLLSYLPDSVGSLKMTFSTDALGRVLAGDDGTLKEEHYHSRAGVKTTINSKIQKITVDAMEDVVEGCAVVMDVSNGAVLACVTKPDTAYLNKPLQQYAVGSVFKIVVAACALENKVDLSYDCEGAITIGDTTFSCYEEHAHGTQTLREALGNSCNCYFVSLASALGAERLLATAEKLGFDDTTTLYQDWQFRNAQLPSLQALHSKGELSLFSFGQGKLTATPLHFAAVIAAIANYGNYHSPKLVTDAVDESGRTTPIPPLKATQAMTTETAEQLCRYLRYVVSDGNARSADYHELSAGKTATAQTGQYENGREKLNCWFTGFYPYDAPRYAIVIMVENGEGGAKECCPIFRTMVEKLESL